jgi:hypothetical protein
VLILISLRSSVLDVILTIERIKAFDSACNNGCSRTNVCPSAKASYYVYRLAWITPGNVRNDVCTFYETESLSLRCSRVRPTPRAEFIALLRVRWQSDVGTVTESWLLGTENYSVKNITEATFTRQAWSEERPPFEERNERRWWKCWNKIVRWQEVERERNDGVRA